MALRTPRDGGDRYGDALRYCEDCKAWTGQEMLESGAYRCMLCGSAPEVAA